MRGDAGAADSGTGSAPGAATGAASSPAGWFNNISALAWSDEKNSLDRLTAGNMAKLTLAINASRDVDLLFILKREATKQ